MGSNSLLSAALCYAEKKGWPVLPLHTIRNGVCTCGKKGECDNPGKHPQWIRSDFEHGAKSATTDPELIRKAWELHPDANVGIATGKHSFDVLDVDLKGDGDGTLADLEAVNGKLPNTVEQITGGGGRQIMFAPCGRLKNEVRFAEGLDVRTDGGLVVVPPSSHISGRTYEWEASSRPDEIELSPLPEWLIKVIEQASPNGNSSGGAGLDIGKVLAGLPEGERDEQLFKYACRLREKGLDRKEAEVMILALARGCKPPFPEAEALGKVESAWKYSPDKSNGSGDTNSSTESPICLEDAILPTCRLLTLSVPEKRSYLAPWLNESSIISVVGWRGVGKSLFTLGAVDAITKGISFGPWQCGDPVNCLIVDGEMAVQDNQRRVADQGDYGRKAELLYYSDHYAYSLGLARANLLNEKWRDGLAEYMLRHSVKVWACDNIASLAPGIDENAKADWDPINQFLLKLRFSGITTILIHHEGKQGTQRGTSAREDNLDICISLKKPSDYSADQGARFVVNFTKSRIPLEYLPLIADHELQFIRAAGDCYEWIWSNARRKDKKAILQAFDEGTEQRDMAALFGVDKSRISRVKGEAIKEGLLTKSGKLTQPGFRYVYGDEN